MCDDDVAALVVDNGGYFKFKRISNPKKKKKENFVNSVHTFNG